jgi:hypothetical protein
MSGSAHDRRQHARAPEIAFCEKKQQLEEPLSAGCAPLADIVVGNRWIIVRSEISEIERLGRADPKAFSYCGREHGQRFSEKVFGSVGQSQRSCISIDARPSWLLLQ